MRRRRFQSPFFNGSRGQRLGQQSWKSVPMPELPSRPFAVNKAVFRETSKRDKKSKKKANDVSSLRSIISKLGSSELALKAIPAVILHKGDPLNINIPGKSEADKRVKNKNDRRRKSIKEKF